LLTVETIVVGDFQTSCHVVFRDGDSRAMVVDPGGEGRRILARIEERSLEVATILVTHGHVDHIAGNEALTNAFPETRLLVGAKDEGMLASPMKNLSALVLKRIKSPPADEALAEGDTVEVAGVEGEVLETPGHTPGGISLYFSAEKNDGQPIVFSGDTLFQMSIGRSDFPGGNGKQLIRSIREKLLTLPPETIVYPGHGGPTTVAEEAAANPFVALRTS